jgi:DNA (cytosine-5)-methyltransferase 1
MATSKKSTGKKSKDLTSSQAATHVNRSQQQENAKARKTQDTCGHGCEKPLANYDPITQSWKMCQDISLWEELRSLERLPKSGMTRNGAFYQQPDWVPIISEKESSSWPTPTASDHIERKSTQQTENSRHSLNLPAAVKRWPTPTAAGDVSNAKGKFPNLTLGDAVRKWPTPKTSDAKRGDSNSERNRNTPCLPTEVHIRAGTTSQQTGKLNPTWVEWLMGFPTGWTDLED